MKTTKLLASIVVIVAVLACSLNTIAGVLEPSAPPAPTMKTLDEVEPRVPIVTAPKYINDSGSYYLTNDLTVSGLNSGLIIQSDNVTVDLMGHTITGGNPSSGSSFGIYINAVDNVVIQNGTIRDFGDDGVYSNGGKNHRVINVRSYSNNDCGFEMATSVIVEKCIANGNGGYGISCGAGAAIRNCVASNNDSTGIIAISSTLSNCTAWSNNDTLGYGFNVTGCSVSNCFADDNEQSGIFAADSTITGFAATNNGQTGINALAGNCQINNSIAKGNGQRGIMLGNECFVSDCSAVNNGFEGIIAFSYCEIKRCNVSGNGRDGIEADSNCRILQNHCVNNDPSGTSSGGGIIVSGSHNLIEGNNMVGNYYGVKLDGSNNQLFKNTAGNNTNSDYSTGSGNYSGQIVTASGYWYIDTLYPRSNIDF